MVEASTLFYLLGDKTQYYAEGVDFVCLALQDYYHGNLTALPSLLVCNSTARWERRLRELCPQLNFLVLKGSEGSVCELK